MTDINKEIQKLKAMINQKQTTAIFSNKSNESTKLAHGDTELYINDMTRKFSFTRAGVINPVMIDARNKTIENVEYINGTRVEDMTGSAQSINELRERVDEEGIEIANIKIKNLEQDNTLELYNIKSSEQDGRLTALESIDHEFMNKFSAVDAKNNEQDDRLTALEQKGSEIEGAIVDILVSDTTPYKFKDDRMKTAVVNSITKTDIENIIRSIIGLQHVYIKNVGSEELIEIDFVDLDIDSDCTITLTHNLGIDNYSEIGRAHV